MKGALVLFRLLRQCWLAQLVKGPYRFWNHRRSRKQNYPFRQVSCLMRHGVLICPYLHPIRNSNWKGIVVLATDTCGNMDSGFCLVTENGGITDRNIEHWTNRYVHQQPAGRSICSALVLSWDFSVVITWGKDMQLESGAVLLECQHVPSQVL